MKNKYLLISIAILLLVGLVGITYIKQNKEEKERVKGNANENLINEFEIKGRVSVKNEGVIYVGENEKQIENGFYDLKIVNGKNGVDIYLNKLWYVSCDEDYIDEDYLINICSSIVKKINEYGDDSELEYILFNYIKDNYIKVRSEEKVELVEINDFTFSLIKEDSMAKLRIKGGKR